MLAGVPTDAAHVACLVHQGLFLRCAAQCGGNLSAQMASRHQLFCQPFHQLRREEPLPAQALDELESRLHAAGNGVTVRASEERARASEPES